MDDTGRLNPWLFELGFFFLRCGVPLLVTFGLSYLFRRLGLISPSPKPPADWNGDSERNSQEQGNGGVAHAKS